MTLGKMSSASDVLNLDVYDIQVEILVMGNCNMQFGVWEGSQETMVKIWESVLGLWYPRLFLPSQWALNGGKNLVKTQEMSNERVT